MVKMRVLLGVFFLLLLVRSGVCEDLRIIEAGWRVGPILLTFTKEDIQRIYGEGKLFKTIDPITHEPMDLLQYKQLGLDILFKKGKIVEIVVYYPNFHVKGGAKVGSSVEKVIQDMGSHYIREDFKDSCQPNIPDYKMIYKGISFFIKKDRVVKISVYPSKD